MCKLYCRVKHDSSYYLLRDKVRDGTKCTVNSFDICVNGMCKPAGCDNVLDSNATLGNVVSKLTETFWVTLVLQTIVRFVTEIIVFAKRSQERTI